MEKRAPPDTSVGCCAETTTPASWSSTTECRGSDDGCQQDAFNKKNSGGKSGCRLAFPLPPLTLKGRWICEACDKTCIVIREECRCLCGHRLKEHTKGLSKSLSVDGPATFGCTNGKCKCRDFFYIVAEGAWILRCRCKHKHVEHDPLSFKCTRTSCSCNKFDSPWVCNCNHPWSKHKQAMEKPNRSADTLSQIGKEMAEDFMELSREVTNLDNLQRDPFGGSVPLVGYTQVHCSRQSARK
ncbi:loc549482 protein, related [Neospora caninum Liverpool]|uniref:Protein FAM221A n=1 Tax=Neospora caninum (strain Liverpool) TaxID=572307 RepID=F0VBF1_NEOCL|nr:loc549482 protein, related [Neospora caninum Liverpool]CBZ50935.1 loc549482 protein, related [Neospora caninum Liverpool]CEL68236.1 TPA: LOC549482 protein, related [Neospora caninum Liverpool]|eukprot:XP_003880968.1 loc549482 protein, related [Neospora caninum Liverpool]